MLLFLSTFINKIDRKGRVSVPASFRSAFTQSVFQGVVVFRSYKYPALEVCGMERMMNLSESVDSLDLFSDLQDDFSATLFADAHSLLFDPEGRILIPRSFLDYANITESAAFVGRGATFQVWNPLIFEKYQQEARDRIRAQKETLKLKVFSENNEGTHV
ncbi:MAG: division/cell wall cluster transcriptional repressor MraZ [Proteobacteria bacterium]|nr:division/cell wall cluster transcriptional repressor MraZ [Pseudomonadota bacterium]